MGGGGGGKVATNFNVSSRQVARVSALRPFGFTFSCKLQHCIFVWKLAHISNNIAKIIMCTMVNDKIFYIDSWSVDEILILIRLNICQFPIVFNGMYKYEFLFISKIKSKKISWSSCRISKILAEQNKGLTKIF